MSANAMHTILTAGGTVQEAMMFAMLSQMQSLQIQQQAMARAGNVRGRPAAGNGSGSDEESDTGLCTTKASRETYSYTHPGGYAWVQEHLGSGYVPTWTQPIGLRNGMGPAETYTGNVDQSLKDTQEQPNQLARRMENYMVGGLKHMLENPPHIDGL